MKTTITAAAMAFAAGTCGAETCGKYLDGYDIASRGWAEATVEEHPVLLRFGDGPETRNSIPAQRALFALVDAARESGDALEALQWLECVGDPNAHLDPGYPTTDEDAEIIASVMAQGSEILAALADEVE